MKIINEKLFSRLFIVGIIVMFCLVILAFVFPVSAAENVTNMTNETEKIDYSEWYQTTTESPYYEAYLYYQNNSMTPTVTRSDVAALLLDESRSEEDRHNAEYVLMGMNDKLKRFNEAEKICVNGTWNIKYTFSFLDNLASFFGNAPDIYTDYYQGIIANMQYNENMKNWVGVKSRYILIEEGY